ncbi:MAG: aldehyde dehydrogenase family protein, partial [Granulosicoccus sp.]|nr:aldehyde dehydrogenase family protein [Granulosicoccus sp.]
SLPGKHLGPLVSEAQYKRVQALIQSGIDEGATVLTGGTGRADTAEAGWFVRPTIFTDVRPDMRIVKEEIFGPVLCMQSFSDEAEAIRLANDTNYGLAAYVNTPDRARARRIALELDAGMVLLNGATHSSRAPFGGVKQSGNGREYSEEGLLEYLEVKVISG